MFTMGSGIKQNERKDQEREAKKDRQPESSSSSSSKLSNSFCVSPHCSNERIL
ncbi:hypothetical protein EXN66_Car009519 [Channa argus]|uniref:Uncharacterized protein n=1 Tax=Channa argus TaxID=215402 RepID=A0A6G1PUI0_CHAAH|nr:hypothetical protein EXN66_Car009519 [Channa argus]